MIFLLNASCYFVRVPDSVVDVSDFLSIAEYVYRLIEIDQFIVKRVIRTVTHREYDAVSRNLVFLAVGWSYDDTVTFGPYDSGASAYFDVIERQESLEHVCVSVACRTAYHEDIRHEFNYRDISALVLLLEPQSEFASDQAAAYNDDLLAYRGLLEKYVLCCRDE
jgi:hypothetical protein